MRFSHGIPPEIEQHGLQAPAEQQSCLTDPVPAALHELVSDSLESGRHGIQAEMGRLGERGNVPFPFCMWISSADGGVHRQHDMHLS